MTRIVLGFLVSPLASGILHGIAIGNLGSMVVAYLFALFFSIVFGFPVFLLFKAISWLRWWQIMSAGIVLGLTVGFMFSLLSIFDTASALSFIKGIGYFGLHGLAVSVTFWFIAIAKLGGSNTNTRARHKSTRPL